MFFVSSSYWIHEASTENYSQMISKKNISAPNLSAWTKKSKIKWPTSLTCSINLSETPRLEKLYLTSCLIVISLKQSFNDNKDMKEKIRNVKRNVKYPVVNWKIYWIYSAYCTQYCGCCVWRELSVFKARISNNQLNPTNIEFQWVKQ